MPLLCGALQGKTLNFKFRTAASSYRIIGDDQNPIAVPYKDIGRRLLDALLRSPEVDYRLLRETQQYTVGVPDHLLRKLIENTTVRPHESGLFWLLMNPDAYAPKQGPSPHVVGIAQEHLFG